jgi:hypothetical protein
MSSSAPVLRLAGPVAVVLAALPCVVLAQLPGPGVRNAHAAVYDSHARAFILFGGLFGGASATEVFGGLWRWRGGWHRSDAVGPDPRTFPALAYDSASDAVVLFGGSRVLFGDSTRPPAMLADTWIFRRNEWDRAPGGPSPRTESAVAYDPRRRRTVLFGGRFSSTDGGGQLALEPVTIG